MKGVDLRLKRSFKDTLVKHDAFTKWLDNTVSYMNYMHSLKKDKSERFVKRLIVKNIQKSIDDNSFIDFIYNSFDIKKTPEGWVFWSDVIEHHVF